MKYKSSEKERKHWEKEGLMSPKKYEYWAREFDEIRKRHPELTEELDKIQAKLEAHIYKMTGGIYHDIHKVAKLLHAEYLVKERGVMFRWEREHPGQRFDIKTLEPYVSSVMYGLMCDLSHMASREPWYFSGPEDDV